jgi:stress response protein YsnF
MSDYSSDLSSSRSEATLTALFDTKAEATQATERLRELGISEGRIRVTEGARTDTTSGAAGEDKGFFEALGDFFFPDEDRHAYAEGLSRGGYLLTVTGLSADLQERALDVLEDAGAVNIDEREAAWRSEGWSGSKTSTLASTGASEVGSPVAASTTGERALGTDETVQVVEEQLKVGRRDANLGRVRVRSYVREEPVSEAVDLTEERVTIERRPVDRPVSAGDDAFRDRSIEAEEHVEEAVIAKEARVVEEINLRKDTETRTETISDTVRKTEVEIEDERDPAAAIRDEQK